jgi:hypothetical protein
MIFPKFCYIKFVFRKNHFRVRNPNSKVYYLIIFNKEVLIEITFLKLLKIYLDLINLFKLF